MWRLQQDERREAASPETADVFPEPDDGEALRTLDRAAAAAAEATLRGGD
jgi:hypothetical protein